MLLRAARSWYSFNEIRKANVKSQINKLWDSTNENELRIEATNDKNQISSRVSVFFNIESDVKLDSHLPSTINEIELSNLSNQTSASSNSKDTDDFGTAIVQPTAAAVPVDDRDHLFNADFVRSDQL